MKDRLKQVRKDNVHGKSQQAFADFLGISISNLASYESGRRIPSTAMIKLICEKCNVNETWLLTGSGEMKPPMSRKAEIAALAAQMYSDPDPFRQKLVNLITNLDENQIECLKNMALELAEAAKDEQ